MYNIFFFFAFMYGIASFQAEEIISVILNGANRSKVKVKGCIATKKKRLI
jgi:hypothetical protein